MTNIIVGKDIIGSFTITNPTIVDPASPFNGQLYDDFDLSSLATTDISSLPFGLAAIEDIGSIKIGEVRSTNIFIQSPAGDSPTGANTTIQLINKVTNNVDAQATSNDSEPLQFIKNADLVGSDYKIRIINPATGDYQLSLAGAILATTGESIAAQNIPEGGVAPNPIISPVDPNIARNFTNGLIYDDNGNVIGAARGIPIIQLPVETDSSTETDPNIGIQLVESPTSPINNDGSTTEIIDPNLSGIDPVIYQNVANGGIPTKPFPEIAILPGPFPAIFLNNNFLSTFFDTGFAINAISQKAGSKVSEIGIFAVDDNTGKIGGIAPGAVGYLQAASNSARSIFSTLGATFFDPSLKREISVEPNKSYGFFEVQDGSIADLKRQLASGKTPTNVLFSLPNGSEGSPIKVTSDNTDGYKVSLNNDQLVLKVVKLDGGTPKIEIGAKSQGLAEGRTIDLTGLTGTFAANSVSIKSSAFFTNNIGFYVVEDAIGTIKLADGVTTLKPGDSGYAAAAVKNAVLQAGKLNFDGGKIYAPVVASQGSFSDFLATNPANIGGNGINTYFNFVDANSDKIDHFRLIGSNTFAVEDQLGGGDRDFNDLVINMQFSQVSKV